MSRIAIIDSTVLTNFAWVRRADLVFSAWQDAVCTTPAALAEYQKATDKRSFPPDYWQGLLLLDLTNHEQELAKGLNRHLGKGESTCLACAQLRDGMLASDDMDARRYAHKMNVPVSGTLGILVINIRDATITLDQANHLLSRMIRDGYRSPLRDI